MKIKTTAIAVYIGTFLAAFAVLAASCTTPPRAYGKDYQPLNPQPANENSRLQEIENEQRAREIEYLKQFEEIDYRFFNGDAEAYK